MINKLRFCLIILLIITELTSVISINSYAVNSDTSSTSNQSKLSDVDFNDVKIDNSINDSNPNPNRETHKGEYVIQNVTDGYYPSNDIGLRNKKFSTLSLEDQRLLEIQDYIIEHVEIFDYYINLRQFGPIRLEEIRTIINDIVFVRPDIFYLKSFYYTYYLENDQKMILNIELNYSSTIKAQLINQVKKFNSEINRIYSLTENAPLVYSSDEEDLINKLLIVEQYISNTYAYDYQYNNYDAYSILATGKGVCQSYALLFKAILDKMGVPNQLVPSDVLEHIWNLVQIDGEWYHIDVTWDAMGVGHRSEDGKYELARATRKYFLKSDLEFKTKLNHEEWNYDACSTADDNSYDGNNFWWSNNVDPACPILAYNHEFYYLYNSSLYKRTKWGYNKHELLSLNTINTWPSFDSDYDFFYNQGTIALDGDLIYYHNPYSIFTYNLKTKETIKVLNVDENDTKKLGYLYSVSIEKDGIIYWLSDNPLDDFNFYSPTRKKLDIPTPFQFDVELDSMFVYLNGREEIFYSYDSNLITDYRDIEWTSADPDIVDFEFYNYRDNRVFAEGKKYGETTITASYYYKGKKYHKSIKIEVLYPRYGMGSTIKGYGSTKPIPTTINNEIVIEYLLWEEALIDDSDVTFWTMDPDRLEIVSVDRTNRTITLIPKAYGYLNLYISDYVCGAVMNHIQDIYCYPEEGMEAFSIYEEDKNQVVKATNASLIHYNVNTEQNFTDSLISWSTSDSNIVSIDTSSPDNFITINAKHIGEAEITAKVKFSTYYEYIQTITVKVIFSDMNYKETSDSYKSIEWALNNNITLGYNKEYFGPNLSMKRIEFAIFLYRNAGCPDLPGKNIFSDCQNYSLTSTQNKALNFCYVNSIIRGYDLGNGIVEFRPNNTISRIDSAIMIYRFLKKQANFNPTINNYKYFPDIDTYKHTSDSYLSVEYLADKGIVKGYSDGTFGTKRECDRLSCIIMLYRINLYQGNI